MKTLLFSLMPVICVLPDYISAQNLVPNGSFEEYTHCPDYWDQLGGNVAGWDVCANSPDFFHTCRDSADLGVPFNWRGYQQASHGQGYGGVITYKWNAPSNREFVCAELSQPLSPGVPADLSMKVALGGFGSYWLYSPNWTSRGIGMLLTTQPFMWTTGSSYPNAAQLYMHTVFTDTTDWVLLSASYVPDSAYQYVTIGNFFEDSLSAPTLLDTVYGNLNGAYVFIDEVCITAAGTECDFANAVDERSFDTWWVTSAFSDRFVITFGGVLERTMELMLCDINGRQVGRRTIAAGTTQFEWPVDGLANGVYVVHSTEQKQGLKPLRVFHVSP